MDDDGNDIVVYAGSLVLKLTMRPLHFMQGWGMTAENKNKTKKREKNKKKDKLKSISMQKQRSKSPLKKAEVRKY
jgi:hypothetical protein